MNKLTKAAIAGGLGIALLLGGAGTLATWNSSSPIMGGTIVAGRLVVGTPLTGTWTVAHLNPIPASTYGTPVGLTMSGNGTLTVTAGGALFAASPGDQLVYQSKVPLIVNGTNLVATLALAPGAIVGTLSSTQQATNTAFANFLTANTVVTMTGTGISGSGTTASPFVINGATNVQVNATVTATITFASSTTAGSENAAMLGSVDLSGMALSLTQNS